MARAILSRKFISRSNGSSYPFKKIYQPFERLELSVRENISAVRTARAPRRQDETISKQIHHSLLNDACRHVYITQTVVTLLFFVYLRLNDTHFIFYGKTFDSQAPIKLKTLRSLRVRGGLRSHALLPCERD